MKKTWAVIGAGNGGQTLAGHLSLLGQKVRIFDVLPATAQTLDEKGGILLEHALQGFGEIEFATSDIRRAVDGADILAVVLPSQYHESIADSLIPYLRDGQTVFLHPEASCGAIAFRRQMRDKGCTADIVVAAASTLLYSCRMKTPGEVCVYGMKKEVLAAALPASDNNRFKESVVSVLPWFKIVQNVLVTSLVNSNAVMHPTMTLLNVSRIDANPSIPFEFYSDGITPAMSDFLERMHEERVETAKALGVEIYGSMREIYTSMYDCGEKEAPLYRLCKENEAYRGIMAPQTLRTRYILEDIPYSLVATQALAKLAGTPTPCIDTIVALGQQMLPGELDVGRTAEALGIEKMTKNEFLNYINGTD